MHTRYQFFIKCASTNECAICGERIMLQIKSDEWWKYFSVVYVYALWITARFNGMLWWWQWLEFHMADYKAKCLVALTFSAWCNQFELCDTQWRMGEKRSDEIKSTGFKRFLCLHAQLDLNFWLEIELFSVVFVGCCRSRWMGSEFI